jgi:hypothetical protein
MAHEDFEAHATEIDEWPTWRLNRLNERVAEIEKLEPSKMAYKLGELVDDVKSVKRLGYAIVIALIGSAISFAFMAFAIAGGG